MQLRSPGPITRVQAVIESFDPETLRPTYRLTIGSAGVLRGRDEWTRGMQAIQTSARQTQGELQGLQRAGYATDPRYADKLTSILNGARMRQTIMA